MKKAYEIPEIEIISVNTSDVITASLGKDRDPFAEDVEWDLDIWSDSKNKPEAPGDGRLGSLFIYEPLFLPEYAQNFSTTLDKTGHIRL